MSELCNGQRWEFVNQTRGTTTEYELERFDDQTVNSRYAHLRNLDSGGVASVTCRWLHEGSSRAPRSHWRLVEERSAT